MNKATVTNSSNTIKRNKQHYRKYFEPSVLHDMKIKKIDELLLEQECSRIVREFNLSRKEWCNIKTILLGLRVGELAGLKWEDCKDLSHLHIVREEVKNQETNQYEVVEHTKAREVYLYEGWGAHHIQIGRICSGEICRASGDAHKEHP